MATTVELELIAKTEQAQKDVTALTGKVDNLTESIDKTEDASKDLAKQNKATTKTAKGVSVATKAIGTALKAIGIGLIIALFAKLAEVFSKNQKVVDLLSNVTTTLSIAFNDFFSLFDGGLPSLDELGKSIKDNIIERFNSALEVAGYLGSALKKLFEGDFAGALDSVKEAGTEFVDVLTGVDDSLGKVVDYTKDIYEQAEATTALANASRLAEAQQRRIFEQYDRDAEVQRRIRDDFELTAQKRLDANDKLKEILDEQEKIQLKLGRISVASARAEIAATGANTDNKVALINALAELDAIEADIAGRRAEQEAQDRALRQEILQERKDDSESVIAIETNKVDKTIDNIKRELDAKIKALKLEKQEEEALAKAKKIITNSVVDTAEAGFGILASVFEKNKGLQKAFLVAESLAGIAKIVINTQAANAAAKLKYALLPGGQALAAAEIISNKLSAGVGVAANIVATTKALSALGGGGAVSSSSGTGGGSAGGGASAPSFNVVGNSGVSQIGQTLNQEQEPIQAYVTSGNVTSAQELDRNIVETASIG